MQKAVTQKAQKPAKSANAFWQAILCLWYSSLRFLCSFRSINACNLPVVFRLKPELLFVSLVVESLIEAMGTNSRDTRFDHSFGFQSIESIAPLMLDVDDFLLLLHLCLL